VLDFADWWQGGSTNHSLLSLFASGSPRTLPRKDLRDAPTKRPNPSGERPGAERPSEPCPLQGRHNLVRDLDPLMMSRLCRTGFRSLGFRLCRTGFRSVGFRLCRRPGFKSLGFRLCRTGFRSLGFRLCRRPGFKVPASGILGIVPGLQLSAVAVLEISGLGVEWFGATSGWRFEKMGVKTADSAHKNTPLV
jgi:hypothetical protein